MKNSALLVLAAGGLGALIWTGFPGLEQVAEPAAAEPASVSPLGGSGGAAMDLATADRAASSADAEAPAAAPQTRTTAVPAEPEAEAALPADELLTWASELGAGGQMQGLLDQLSQQ